MIVDVIRPRGWDPSGTYSGGCDRREDPNPIQWRDCPHCWRAGQIYSQEPGDVWTVERCPVCLGVGQVVR